jgi:hypothetical protein
MRAYLLCLLMMSSPSLAEPTVPLELPWEKELNYTFQKYKNYRYLFGSVEYGEMRFSGQVHQTYETELIIQFYKSKISTAWLVFGPTGIDEFNCKGRYKEIVSAMSRKYGTPKSTDIVRESIMSELVFSSECYAIGVGVAEITTRWIKPPFEIKVSLFSDNGVILIEAQYTYTPLKGVTEDSLESHL